MIFLHRRAALGGRAPGRVAWRKMRHVDSTVFAFSVNFLTSLTPEISMKSPMIPTLSSRPADPLKTRGSPKFNGINEYRGVGQRCLSRGGYLSGGGQTPPTGGGKENGPPARICWNFRDVCLRFLQIFPSFSVKIPQNIPLCALRARFFS